MKKKLIIIVVIVFAGTMTLNTYGMGLFDFLFKSKKTEEAQEAIQYDHESIKSTDFERYILVKGENLKSVENKLKDYGELPAKGNTYTYTFVKAQLDGWTIIKMPSDFKDYYSYHNLVFWFLGYPPEDENYADMSVGLAIKKDSDESYILYNDYSLVRALKLEDEMIGVFNNDQKFILSIPFDEYRESKNSDIKNYKEFIKVNDIDLKKIKSGKIEFTEFGVFFNEK